MDKQDDFLLPNSHIKKMVQIAEEQISGLGLNMNQILQKELEQFRKLTELDIHVPAKEMASAAQIINDVNEITNFTVSHDLVSNLIKHQRELSNQIGAIFQNNSALMRITHNTAIQQSAAAISEIQNLPFREILEHDIDNLSQNKPDIDDQFLSKLLAYLKDKASNLPKGEISKVGVLNLAFQIINCYLLIVGLHQAEQSSKQAQQGKERIVEANEETRKSIDEFADKLTPLIEDLSEQDEKSEIVEVKRECPIRAKPTAASDTLLRAFKGKSFEIVESFKRWYQVKYFNPADSTIRTGFIYKGHVQY
ncbi:hypothetical protein [Fodinibius sp. Rm-B-1B1-1]|uniref:hypothetical protein n=1 Tax=Fodinibius alkaliphilus TaxID=3140241 RepID=UPI00315A2AE4